MQMRDNNKPLTPSLKASRSGSNDVLRSAARPGGRSNKVTAGADNVMSANGKTPRPGGRAQKAPQAGGRGTIARPGWRQGVPASANK